MNRKFITKMTEKKQRSCLTLDMKRQILREKDQCDRSVRKLATDMSLKFGIDISRSQIQRTITDRKRILETVENNSADAKRKRYV